ncbi:RagB/SusD family nutrient uptake outer membrane protein [Pedobacter terrae]|uniref:RagB/SusD family nutrient uptake outer membrane protein n=1 Tax=Pedobacter terrae TaxID=405671 RepID=UPI002FFC24E1
MKIFKIFSLLLLIVILGGCKKFLAEYSQDEMRPSTTDDLAAIMYSEAYPYSVSFDNLDLLTDDVQSNGLSTSAGSPVAAYVTAMQNGTPQFTFNPEMFDANSVIPKTANLYENYYSKIKGCNVVMDNLGQVSGSEQSKNAILGQCLFLRAYYHLRLVLLYSQPYTSTGVNPETSLGVPLILSSQVRDGGIKRPTLKQTYDQIEADLLKAAELLKINYTQTSNFRVGVAAAYACLTRFYLLRGLDADVDKVITYANKTFEERSILTPLTTFFTSSNAISGTGIYDGANAEVLWTHGGNSRTDFTYFASLTAGAVPPFAVSGNLTSTYEQGPNTSNYGDLRYQMYFTKYTNSGTFPYSSAKSSANAQGSGSKGFRLSEVYLNRAEALIKRFMKTGNVADRTQALADLNYLRSNRYDTRNTAYIPVNITDANALFTFYQQERRRELALEDNFRWQDIRRWALPVVHNYIASDGQATTYTLPANSPLYALPIPFKAITNNPNLEQNPR